MSKKKLLLSFDIEEFDMPEEYGRKIPFERQIQVSYEGTKVILDILKSQNIQATFFSTVTFAQHAQDLITRITDEGHELASHGVFHSYFEDDHLRISKLDLEKISGKRIHGYRMARMKPVKDDLIAAAGYTYNSSLNPVYLPGRYNNFFKPRTMFHTNNLLQIPASATPLIRFPLFWLSFHNIPLWLYKLACKYTINSDHYLNIYFHPWEFTELSDPAFGLPKYVTKNTGSKMIERFHTWISWMKQQHYEFSTITSFITNSDMTINKIAG
jgi:peptidoglycan/xylan/chitin deacetylase (PgdA/CDA1 family)